MVNQALPKYFHVFIIIYTLTFVECQNPERIGNSTFTYTGAKYDTVTYSCKMGSLVKVNFKEKKILFVLCEGVYFTMKIIRKKSVRLPHFGILQHFLLQHVSCKM
jgi:hypothetical protein